jgi:hypothetical protein
LLACGQKFTGVEAAPSAGAGGMPSSAGSATAGSNIDGGVDSGGSDAGGRGGTPGAAGKGGKGGAPNLGGAGHSTGGVVAVAGDGSGGAVVVGPAPVPLDGLELWFRADQGVTQSNGVVATWSDMSGHRRDALQTALNYRPKLADGALAGKPALVFDGVDDFLKLPTLDVDFAQGLSLFIAMQQVKNHVCEGFFEASNNADNETDDVHFGDWQDSLLFEVEQNWVNDTNFPLLLNAPQIAAVIQEPSRATHVRSNSNAVGEGDVDLPPLASRQQVFIGHSSYKDCVAYDGVIGELLVYSRGVSDQELLQIEGYLQNKWGCCSQ